MAKININQSEYTIWIII